MSTDLTLHTAMGWGKSDIYVLEQRINTAEHFGVQFSDIIEDLEEGPALHISDIEDWYQVVLKRMRDAIAELARTYSGEELAELIKEDNGFWINYMASGYKGKLQGFRLAEYTDKQITLIKKLAKVYDVEFGVS